MVARYDRQSDEDETIHKTAARWQAMSISDTMTFAFNELRANFRQILIVGLPCMLFLLIFFTISEAGKFVAISASSSLPDGADSNVEPKKALFLTLQAVSLGFLVLSLPVFVLTSEALVIMGLARVCGENVASRQLFKGSLVRFFPFVGVSLLSGIIIFTGYLFFVIPGVFFSIALAQVPQVFFAEKEGMVRSLTRSWQLTKGRMVEVFFLWMCLYAVQGSAVAFVVYVYNIFSLPLLFTQQYLLALGVMGMTSVLYSFVSYIGLAFHTFSLSALYIDSRVKLGEFRSFVNEDDEL